MPHVRKVEATEDGLYLHYDAEWSEPGQHVHFVPHEAIWARQGVYDIDADTAVEHVIAEIIAPRADRGPLTASDRKAAMRKSPLTVARNAKISNKVPKPPKGRIEEHRKNAEQVLGQDRLKELRK